MSLTWRSFAARILGTKSSTSINLEEASCEFFVWQISHRTQGWERARLRIEMSGDQRPTIGSLRIKVYLAVGVDVTATNPNELQRTIIQLSNINTNLRSGNKNDN